jgi:hypothetical protein
VQDIRQSQGVNVPAIVGLVLVFVPVPILSGVAAVVLGAVALRQLDVRPQRGFTVAILAIVLGGLNIAGWSIPFLFFGIGSLIANLTHTNIVF